MVNFFIKLFKIAKYLPILWRDQDWDERYILILLQFKLKNVREHISKYSSSVNKQDTIKNIRIAELLIDRINNKDYIKPFREKLSNLDDTKNKEFIEDKGYYIWPMPGEEYLKYSSKVYKHELYMRNQDLEYLFKHIKKYINTWWD